MSTMIEDAVDQLKRGIDRTRTAQRCLYGSGQQVVVRSTSVVKGHERKNWRPATVVGSAILNGRRVYRIRVTDPRGRREYRIAGAGSLLPL